jgi:hypothetical protein
MPENRLGQAVSRHGRRGTSRSVLRRSGARRYSPSSGAGRPPAHLWEPTEIGIAGNDLTFVLEGERGHVRIVDHIERVARRQWRRRDRRMGDEPEERGDHDPRKRDRLAAVERRIELGARLGVMG